MPAITVVYHLNFRRRKGDGNSSPTDCEILVFCVHHWCRCASRLLKIQIINPHVDVRHPFSTIPVVWDGFVFSFCEIISKFGNELLRSENSMLCAADVFL